MRVLLILETCPVSTTSYPPTDCTAVLSAMAGLTAEFGMGSGDPCLHGRAHGTCSLSRPAAPDEARALAAAWRPQRADDRAGGTVRRSGAKKRRARAISTARLSASPRLQLRPIDQMVYLGPYRKGNSSWGRLPA